MIPTDAKSAGGSQAFLLVVDDDPFQRKVVNVWLSGSGWTVREAANGDEALEQVPDARVVLIDLRLGDADGFDVARRIGALSLDPAPALVAMSADMSESVRERCRRAGFDHTMAKPFQREGLLEVLRGLTSGHKAAAGPNVASESGAVPEPLRDVPALAALWRLEQVSLEPELVPAVEGLRQAGRLLTAAAVERTVAGAQAVGAAAHGLAGAAGILGCTRVEATSKALAVQVRRQGLDESSRMLVGVIENELKSAVAALLAKIEAARRISPTDPRTSRHEPSR